MAKERKEIASNNPCIKLNENKCTYCGLCQVICTKHFNIGNECVYCGQCIMHCPMKALTTTEENKKVIELLKDNDKIFIASVAPAVRVALGDEFSLPYGENVTGKIVASLHQMGFDYVFDVSFGADITTIEETNELLERIEKKQNLPLFSSCCPSWTAYLKLKHPELINHLSTTKTPIQIQGYAVKKYFSKIKNIDEKKIIHVVFTPCVSKKMESKDDSNIDYSLTTRELALMIKESKIDFLSIKDEEFDLLLSEATGTGEMFGCSSGLTNAIINNITNTDNHIHDKYNQIEHEKKIIKCLSIHGCTNFESHLNEIYDYDFIEVMSCEFGCVGGGGQPLNPIGKLNQIRNIRKESLKNIKKHNQKLIKDNEEVKYFYESLNKKDELHLK